MPKKLTVEIQNGSRKELGLALYSLSMLLTSGSKLEVSGGRLANGVAYHFQFDEFLEDGTYQDGEGSILHVHDGKVVARLDPEGKPDKTVDDISLDAAEWAKAHGGLSMMADHNAGGVAIEVPEAVKSMLLNGLREFIEDKRKGEGRDKPEPGADKPGDA